MPKASKGQFDSYKKWTSSEGYTFLARDKEDAKLYLKKMDILGSEPVEVVVETSN